MLSEDKRRSGSILHALTLIILIALTVVISAPISYSGRVQNQASSALAGARVWVPGTLLFTYTNTNGQFVLEGDIQSTIRQQMPHDGQSPYAVRWHNGALYIGNPFHSAIDLEAFTADGRRILHANPDITPETIIPLTASQIKSGVLLIRVKIDGRISVFRCIPENGLTNDIQVISSFTVPSGLARMHAAYEISATMPGYLPGTFPQAGSSASGLILTLASQTSDSIGIFRPYYEGLGVITDVSTGQKVMLPAEKRINVIVFPEGYLAADLAAGKYESDLARWYNEAFRVTPMDFFREAFVIWKYPAVSNQHIVADGTADTYFGINIVSGSVSSALDTCRARMWRIISNEFPYRASLQYYPSGGNTSRQAKNMTVSFMIYDPQYGRTGFSGITTTLTNPADANQRMATAFALGHQHEFMHALVKLGDEYYDQAHTALSNTSLRRESAYITNVVCCPSCDSLPWQHLLFGGQYNPGVDSLVGAFGTNGRYHPELKCLLNGSHDNALLYGGSNNLRTDDRMCNWCRELAAFRIYERCMVLDNTTTSWSTWTSSYRQQFYQVIGFNTPAVVPQQNSVGTSWFLPCSP